MIFKLCSGKTPLVEEFKANSLLSRNDHRCEHTHVGHTEVPFSLDKASLFGELTRLSGDYSVTVRCKGGGT